MKERQSRLSLEESLADLVKTWAFNRSKDPTSKVGAAIYDHDTGGVFLGYNGFPRGIPDDESIWNNREVTGDEFGPVWSKYDLVVHAEVNAAQKALRAGVVMERATLVCTHLPCERCMKDIVASLGIRRVMFGSDDYNSCTNKTRTFAAYIASTLNISLEKFS